MNLRRVMTCFSIVLALSTPSAVAAELDFNALLQPAPRTAKLADDDWFIWGGSMVRDDAGKCHLFYSRWPRSEGFRAWVTHSEVAHAVADDPLGPYTHVDVALPARGEQYWDGLVTHNPTVHKFDGTYYLYYTGNTLGETSTDEVWWKHRNNQRVGVAVADHPDGPWKRFDQPLIDVGQGDAPDALITTNPSVCRRPDGGYLIVYKAAATKLEPPSHGPVVHMVALSDSPTGPFVKQESLAFTKPGEKFPAEDPTVWNQDGRYRAVVKDMKGVFTGAGKSLALFESDDGIDWKLAANPLVSRLQVKWEDGEVQKLHSLERPQLWLDNGVPAILFCAARVDGDNENPTFNVHIPLIAD